KVLDGVKVFDSVQVGDGVKVGVRVGRMSQPGGGVVRKGSKITPSLMLSPVPGPVPEGPSAVPHQLLAASSIPLMRTTAVSVFPAMQLLEMVKLAATLGFELERLIALPKLVLVLLVIRLD